MYVTVLWYCFLKPDNKNLDGAWESVQAFDWLKEIPDRYKNTKHNNGRTQQQNPQNTSLVPLENLFLIWIVKNN